jgi:hypothetical protein
MEYRLPCACGSHVLVTEHAAGTTVNCSCGQAIDVPSWRELNARAGRRAPALNPEVVLNTLLSAGKMPFEDICTRCGTETNERVQVMAEFERAVVRGGGISWPALILSALFLPVLIFTRRRTEVYGRDKVYWLPLPVCKQCQEHVQDEADLRRAVRKVEVYDDLLEKFPQARIRLATPRDA